MTSYRYADPMARHKSTYYLAEDIRTATKVAAAARHKSESDVVEEALRQYLQTDDQVAARDEMRALFARLDQRQQDDPSLRMSEDEAMKLAVAETHAERTKRWKAEGRSTKRS